MSKAIDALAIDGGTPVANEPFPSTWHGPAEIGDEEIGGVGSSSGDAGCFRELGASRAVRSGDG